MRAALLALAMIVTACEAPVPTAPTPTASPSAAPAETPTASPQATTAATATPSPGTGVFPDVRIVAAAATGDIRIYEKGAWQFEAKICPDPVPFSTAIHGFAVAANGRTLAVQCSQEIAGSADRAARDAFVYDLVTKEKRPVTGTTELGIGPISPDGRQLVVAALGVCPMPAPVCQTKRLLVDLATGDRGEILPSDYWLEMEMRWTAIGLSYFLPECANAGCAGPDMAGTYLWSASLRKWDRISTDRLVATNGVDRHLLERRRTLGEQREVSVVEIADGKERVLTPPGKQPELALGVLADRRAIAWRPRSEGSFDGEIVIYRDGHEERRTAGRFSGYLNGAGGDSVFAMEVPGSTMHAYSVARDTFATLAAPFSISRYAVLPASGQTSLFQRIASPVLSSGTSVVVDNVVIQPGTTGHRLYATDTATTQMWRSDDGGASWQMMLTKAGSSAQIAVTRGAVLLIDGGHVTRASGRTVPASIWRSSDGGVTWDRAHGVDPEAEALIASAGRPYAWEDTTGRTVYLAVSVPSPTFGAATPPSEILGSSDGLEWRHLGHLPGPAVFGASDVPVVSFIKNDPRDGISRVEGDATSSLRLAPMPASQQVWSLYRAPADGSLWQWTINGTPVRRSRDGGKSWERAATGLSEEGLAGFFSFRGDLHGFARSGAIWRWRDPAWEPTAMTIPDVAGASETDGQVVIWSRVGAIWRTPVP